MLFSKIKNSAFCFLIYLISNIAIGQDIEVTGEIQDTNNQPVAFASVSFRTKENPDLAKGVLSDENGNFKIYLEKTEYIMEVSLVGLKPEVIPVNLRGRSSKFDLGFIRINTDVLMDEVVLESEKTQRIALDKKTYYVGKDIMNNGGNLIDIMQNLPSVQTQVDGSVSIRGDGNVQILIDGRLTGLSSLTSLLRTIPASSVEKIEVITNPSSRYNADGTGGIINVVLKKNRNKFLSGSAELFAGIRLNSGLNLNLNRSSENFSWYYNGGIGYSEPKSWSKLQVISNNPESLEYQQDSERFLKQFYVLNNLGATYQWDRNNNFGVDLTYRLADLNSTAELNYYDFENSNFSSASSRNEDENFRNNNYLLRADYKHVFKDSVSNLELGWFKSYSSEDGNSEIAERQNIPTSQLLNTDFVNNRIIDKRNTLSADLLNILKDTSQIEFGSRWRNTIIDNNFQVSRDDTQDRFILENFSDITNYSENILAFYFQYGKSFQKFSYQLGLRSESTAIDLKTTENEESFNYTNFFPSAFFKYELNNKESLRLSFSRRISRPRRNALVSFSSFTDSRNIYVGNPGVQPTLSYITELGFRRKFNNDFQFVPSLFFKYSTQVQDYFVEKQNILINDSSEEISVTRTVNIGNRKDLGLELSTSYKPLSWFDIYSEFLVSGFDQKGSYSDQNFESTGFDSSGRLHLNFDLPKDVKFQLQHRFRGGNKIGIYERKPVYRMDAALSTNLFGKNGMLSINAKDLFNTWKFNMTTFGDSFTQDLETQIRTPQVTVAFSYNFNQSKYKGNKGQQYDKLD